MIGKASELQVFTIIDCTSMYDVQISLTDWLDENQGLIVRSINVLYGGDGFQCLITYT